VVFDQVAWPARSSRWCGFRQADPRWWLASGSARAAGQIQHPFIGLSIVAGIC
jgi:hypothetical protein